MSNNYTEQELKTAYQIISQDLFTSLLKVESGESIKLGNLGKLTKKERKQKCGWDQQNYVYANVHFKPFGKLKKTLNEQIINKYRSKNK